jgi:pyruvate/2-oxoglutarate dehydrogenase complex dihydrolipoamide acyltransferase (E2) component
MSGHRDEPFPKSRRIVVDSGAAARNRHTVYGLIEVDITEATSVLAGLDPKPSLTSYVVASTGTAVEAVPYVHALRNLRQRLIIFDDVDVNVMIEVELEGRSFPMNHVIRRANQKSLIQIDDEIRAVKLSPETSPTMGLSRQATLFLRLPGFVRHRLIGLLHRLPERQRDLVGTVGISSVGMFGRGGGWGIGFSVQTLTMIVGGVAEKPAVVNGEIVARTFLDLSLAFDHDVVDGAPAARFVAKLKEILESGAVLPADD